MVNAFENDTQSRGSQVRVLIFFSGLPDRFEISVETEQVLAVIILVWVRIIRAVKIGWHAGDPGRMIGERFKSDGNAIELEPGDGIRQIFAHGVIELYFTGVNSISQ